MYSLETIQAMNRKVTIEAEKEGEMPYTIREGEITTFPPFPFPNLGDYIPKGWVRLTQYFVDKTGLGMEDELALTVAAFRSKLIVGRSYAIVEEGKFQLHVGEFIRTEGEKHA